MLQALYTVLEHEVNNLEPIFILAPTAVVNTFCRNHGECDEYDVVKSFVHFLEVKTLEQLRQDHSIRRNREKVCITQYLCIFISLHIISVKLCVLCILLEY